MPVTYSLSEGILCAELSSYYSNAEIIDCLEEALDDEGFKPGMNILIDATRSARARTTDEVLELVNWIRTKRDRLGMRCAIVASTDVHYGMSRMLAYYVDSHGVSVEVFRNMEDGVHWVSAEP